jgi:hypothetical protein
MSFALAGGFPTFSRPKKTQTAGTIITSLIQPRNKMRTKVTTLKYTAAGTAHTLTILRPLSKVKIVTAVAAGGTSYVLSRDPGNYSANATLDALKGPNSDGAQFALSGNNGGTPIVANNLIASGDFLAIQTAQPGTFFLATVSGSPATAANGQCTVTATAAPTGGVPAGAEVYFFGTTTDTHPVTGEAHPAYTGAASVTTTIDGNGGEVASAFGVDEPLLIHSDNATAAGTLELATGVYSVN